MENADEGQPLIQKVSREKLWKKALNFKVESSLIFLLFGWNLSSSIIPNQLLQQTCVLNGFNTSICAKISESSVTKDIEEIVQPQVAKVLMVISLLTMFVPGLLTSFLVPLSDRFGRKKVICTSICGYALTLLLFTLTSIASKHFSISQWFYAMAYIPLVCTGGLPSIVLSTLCYVTDVADDTSRSFRMVLTETFMFLGVLTGTASSSYVLNMTSPTTVFIISTTIVTITAIHGICFFGETVPLSKTMANKSIINELFSLKPLIEIVETCFKHRPYHGRKIFWCIAIIIMLSVFAINGESTVFYLFARQKFHWGLKEVTLYDSTSYLVSIFGCMIAFVILKKFLLLSDIKMAFIAIISALFDSFVKAIASNSWELYFASLISMFKVLTLSLSRAIIATVIPSTEIGRAFTMISLLETCSNLIAPPAFTFVYAATFQFNASTFYFPDLLICGVNLVLIYFAAKMMSSKSNYFAGESKLSLKNEILCSESEICFRNMSVDLYNV